MQSTIEWLLEADQPSIRYRTLTEILDRPSDDQDVRSSFTQIPKKGWAAQILKEQLPSFAGGWSGYWHNYSLLNRPKYITTVWKFLVLADLGLKATNEQMLDTCILLRDRYLKAKYQYHLCMTANITRALIQSKFDDQRRIRRAIDWLVAEQKDDGGWHCFSPDKGTLDCWEPLSAFASLKRDRWNRGIKRSVERGAEFYLERRLHREGKKKYEPWFRFHYPVHYYYDLLVGLEVLTSLGYANDRRMKLALDLLRRKRSSNGRWNLDAVQPDLASEKESSYSSVPPYEPFPAIPFALEKAGRPSKIITLRALKVLKLVDEVGA